MKERYENLESFEVNRAYRHWKGKLYYVHGLAVHTETDEMMVYYQTLYGDRSFYVRPISQFTEKVPLDREAENVTGQLYRFEPYDFE
ncbi:hypothetical protein HNQ80_004609 [Anaerosolibacter carboniphilus]|uniref:DUF1653 domain-containing protein n=1 Tax=Anaerosolibacter carboniphilus TaxID=1417629 RepID=A0A841L849_9FIRM|nr:DUF1653 domain-containing protein [Anaerosolibacter carboniphilus]MBB6218445.1 hypothetical protein [Anaerosolibacter carboniphilus]